MSADPISDFYTCHPYPPPVENLDRARDEWRDPLRQRAEHHLIWPFEPYRADRDILVAGCGTFQAAKYALTHPHARVTGIDVSPTSVEHTVRLKRQYDLTNLDVQQVSIEEVAGLRRQFDLIVCTGVLHHLADPDAGLQALRGVLRREGALYLMVYAPYGRTGVYLLQDYCRRLGIGTAAQEVAELMATLDALPPQHPFAALLRGARDAQSGDALADALLNPRDRAYSVPQLHELVERNGLRFDRWYWQGPYLPQCGSIASTPHAARLASLPPRERDAAMELWRGTMATHSVILSRPESERSADGWVDDPGMLDYVPLRMPWTIVVRDRLPAGAAAVLINRSHVHPDLVLPLDVEGKRLFDGIDGRRSIAEIVRATGVETERARTVFRTLWTYDQIVFDASRQRP